MFNPLSIVKDYDSLDFINKLPAYNSNAGVDTMLDLMREIVESGNYYWQGLVFPAPDLINIPANGDVTGSIQVPPGTIITGLTYYADYVSSNFPVMLNIWDQGSQASLFYGDYALDRTVASNMQLQVGVGASNPPSDPGMNGDNPFGSCLNLGPFVVTTPGVLTWELVNLGAQRNIQVMLSAAVPITDRSIGHMIVDKNYLTPGSTLSGG